MTSFHFLGAYLLIGFLTSYIRKSSYYLSPSSFLMEAFKDLFEKHSICIPQDFKKIIYLFVCLMGPARFC